MFIFLFLRGFFITAIVLCIAIYPSYLLANNPEIYYIHGNHQNGSSIITDENMVIDEIVDYYPYGSLRLNNQYGAHNEKRKFIGEEYDELSGLNYLNARYYNSRIGRFLSQDPEFWNLGFNYLIDPQQANSYNYSRNNPIVYSDPSGLSSATSNPIPTGGWQIGQVMGQFNGVNAYYNGIGSSSTTRSCVEYAKRYMSQIYGINNIGPVVDAKTMWSMTDTINERLTKNNSPYTFEKNNNGGATLPGEGDLLFWTEGRYGHVMVVTESKFNQESGRGYVEIIDQNASKQAIRALNVQKTDKGYTIMKNSSTPVAGWFSRKATTKSNVSQQTNTSVNTSASSSKSSLFKRIWNGAKQLIKKIW